MAKRGVATRGKQRGLGELQRAWSEANFVGREQELRALKSLFGDGARAPRVAYLHGPGGVGKSSLLRALAREAEAQGGLVEQVDARHYATRPEALTEALAKIVAKVALPQRARAPQLLLTVDTFETAPESDAWIRDEFLPRLPAGVRVALATRRAPGPGWRAMPGWGELVRAMAVRNLARGEAERLLDVRGVPTAERDGVLAFTHGHPLALVLAAQGHGRSPGRYEPGADVIATLCEQFLAGVPDADRQSALDACAVLRVTTEPSLAAALDKPDVRELFRWLRGLSFVEHGEAGLFPHDLAREAFMADLRWRNGQGYEAIVRRAHAYYMGRTRMPDRASQIEGAAGAGFLLRHDARLRAIFEVHPSETNTVRDYLPGDADAVVALVRTHEGEPSAVYAAHWLRVQPEAFSVVAGPDGGVTAFTAVLDLHSVAQEDIERDPVALAAWNHACGLLGPQHRRKVIYVRFSMTRDGYQRADEVFSLLTTVHGEAVFGKDDYTFSYAAYASPHSFRPAFELVGAIHEPSLDFEQNGRSYEIWVHDHRGILWQEWLSDVAERTVRAALGAPVRAPDASALAALGAEEFRDAVRVALRSLHSPRDLRDSPLLESRITTARAGADATSASRVAALQGLLREAAEALEAEPRRAAQYRALHDTYLEPGRSQEAAAEAAGQAYSTYRRNVARATEFVADWLWRVELEGEA